MGIGNPGAEYRDTRHNAGHWCVQRLVEETNTALENRRLARTGQADIDGRAVVLSLARTYVNLSGEAAEYLLTRYRAEPGRLIVVTDDINLPVGAVRIRKQGERRRTQGAPVGDREDRHGQVHAGPHRDRQARLAGQAGRARTRCAPTWRALCVGRDSRPRRTSRQNDHHRGRRDIHEPLQFHGAGRRR